MGRDRKIVGAKEWGRDWRKGRQTVGMLRALGAPHIGEYQKPSDTASEYHCKFIVLVKVIVRAGRAELCSAVLIEFCSVEAQAEERFVLPVKSMY